MPQRYRIVSDDDGHNFVIPAEMLTEWEDYDWEANHWNYPIWAQSIGGNPNMVTFTDPVIE